METETASMTELRRTGAIADRINAGQHIHITDHGHDFAVILPVADYRSLIAYRDDHQEQQ